MGERQAGQVQGSAAPIGQGDDDGFWSPHDSNSTSGDGIRIRIRMAYSLEISLSTSNGVNSGIRIGAFSMPVSSVTNGAR